MEASAQTTVCQTDLKMKFNLGWQMRHLANCGSEPNILISRGAAKVGFGDLQQ